MRATILIFISLIGLLLLVPIQHQRGSDKFDYYTRPDKSDIEVILDHIDTTRELDPAQIRCLFDLAKNKLDIVDRKIETLNLNKDTP